MGLNLDQLDVIAIDRGRVSIAVKLNGHNTAVELAADNRTRLAGNTRATLFAKRAPAHLHHFLLGRVERQVADGFPAKAGAPKRLVPGRLSPTNLFFAGAVQLATMRPAQRYCKFIADLLAEPAGPCKTLFPVNSRQLDRCPQWKKKPPNEAAHVFANRVAYFLVTDVVHICMLVPSARIATTLTTSNAPPATVSSCSSDSSTGLVTSIEVVAHFMFILRLLSAGTIASVTRQLPIGEWSAVPQGTGKRRA
ncbi:hypothetical protein [Bradyrhizobium sp. OAE829]|uniref:hypothetical protein n=1 Tax=Bradyrhizobium sp. OAE829 TaxID=2663807 RepID=UPI00178AF75E